MTQRISSHDISRNTVLPFGTNSRDSVEQSLIAQDVSQPNESATASAFHCMCGVVMSVASTGTNDNSPLISFKAASCPAPSDVHICAFGEFFSFASSRLEIKASAFARTRYPSGERQIHGHIRLSGHLLTIFQTR